MLLTGGLYSIYLQAWDTSPRRYWSRECPMNCICTGSVCRGGLGGGGGAQPDGGASFYLTSHVLIYSDRYTYKTSQANTFQDRTSQDITSQLQNVPNTKRSKHKTSQASKRPNPKTYQPQNLRNTKCPSYKTSQALKHPKCTRLWDQVASGFHLFISYYFQYVSIMETGDWLAENSHNKNRRIFPQVAWDVLRLGTFWGLGRFIAGTFCIWDVFGLRRFEAGDVLKLGCFGIGTFCSWDVVSWYVLYFGRFRVGTFVLGRFVSVPSYHFVFDMLF